MLLRAIMLGAVWNGFLLSKSNVSVSVISRMEMDTVVGSVAPTLPMSLSFYFLWHVTALSGLVSPLAGLASRPFFSPWRFFLFCGQFWPRGQWVGTCILGTTYLHLHQPHWDWRLGVHGWAPSWTQSNSLTDGSRDSIDHLDVEIAGSGAFIHSLAVCFDSHVWGHRQYLDDIDERSSQFRVGSCRADGGHLPWMSIYWQSFPLSIASPWRAFQI